MCLLLAVLKRYRSLHLWSLLHSQLQQCLPLAVCDKGCETAEEQSGDEVRTSLVLDQRKNEKDGVKALTACGIETLQRHRYRHL